MKKNKLTLLAFIAIATLMVTSCSKESLTDPNVEPAKETKAPGKLVFSFNLPSTEAIVFTRAADVNQTTREAAVKSLWMYEFTARDGKLVGTPTDIFSSLTQGSSDYTYTYTGSAYEDSKARRFVFLANETKARDITNISQLNDDNAATTTDARVEYQIPGTGTIDAPVSNDDIWQTVNGEKVLPMTGEAVRNGNKVIAIDSLTSTTVYVDLTRTVARIDVRNFTPGLTITELKLVKANGDSYVMPHVDADGKPDLYNNASSTAKVDNIATVYADLIKGDNTVPEAFDFTSSYNATGTTGNPGYEADEEGYLRRAFYVYEDSLDTNPLTLQVKGTVGNVNVFYNIPFRKDIAWVNIGGTDYQYGSTEYNNAVAPAQRRDITEAVSIKRNHRYTVEIGDGTQLAVYTAVRAKIKVKDWTTQEVTETFDPDIFVYTGTAWAAEGVTYHTSDQILDVPAKALDKDIDGEKMQITISDNYSNIKITDAVPMKELTEDGTDWLKLDFDETGNDNKGVITLGTDANPSTTDIRSRSFKVTYTITPSDGSDPTTHYIVFTVRQDKATS